MGLTRKFTALVLFTGLTACAVGQGVLTPVFDTTSIRPSDPGDTSFGSNPNPNNFQGKRVTLLFLIELAYGANPSDIVGIPAALQDARFDIHAKADVDPASPAAALRYSSDEGRKLFQVRLQALLQERFHLQVHPSMAERPVLYMEAGSHPVLRAALQQHPMQTFGSGYLKFDAVDMAGFASALSGQLSTNVLDRTHLSGSYALEVKWEVQAEGEPLHYPFATVSNALKDQLGLKLVQAKASVPILVVDGAQAPSPN